jgi:predicted extracellular nuclease
MKKILLSAAIFTTGLMGFSQAPCSDLFFSEYIEGSGQNKALEVYNPTPNPVDLSNYHIYRYLNGGTAVNDTLYMAGMLAPGATYNIVNSDTATPPSTTLLNLADTLHTVTFFNGDDALGLFNGNTLIDIIGNVGGTDPGTEWLVDTGSTKENTLIRKPNVFGGTTSWTIGATQWLVYGQNYFSDFGMHTMAPCSTATVANEQAWDVSIFPNPSSGTLNISSELNDYTLQVFDLTGKSVISKTNLSENAQIDVTDLTNGIYMVKLNQGNNQLTKKIIIKK